MAHIYIAFVDTPGIFALLIHKYIRQKYIHVVLSMDPDLNEAYSVGRRNPFVPILAGFERENKEKICQAFPTAEYQICRIEVSPAQKDAILERLRQDYERRGSIHYAVIGLVPLVFQRPFYQKNHYTCASYLARVLEENGLPIADKHFSLITPKDFYEYPDKKCIFEGKLARLLERDRCGRGGMPGVVYE